jgi:hypothetical protein
MGVTMPLLNIVNFSQFFTPVASLEAMSNPFTHAEIDGVFAHIPGDKTPGPNVFLDFSIKFAGQL